MLSPGQAVDKFTVESVIGHGGTAVVYLVRHQQLNSLHALKVLSLSSEGIRERLLREGRVQAALQHTNIVSVTDVLDVEGSPGLVMEYVEGPSLDQAMRRYLINVEDALTLFRGVVAGVRAAHRHGLVHRDLKPANVLLFQSPEGFVPKVTDFGLAKLLVGVGPDLGETRQGIAMGTPSYMAPEQIRDARSVDQSADVFSLGCMLYELVTRQRAFPGTQALEIYNNIVIGRYVPAEELVSDLPDAVIQAIDGALIIDREKRIPSCDVLLDVLAGRRGWEYVPHPVPDEVTATEEIPKDAPVMSVARRKLTPMASPPREAAPSDAGEARPAVATWRVVTLLVLLLVVPIAAIAFLLGSVQRSADRGIVDEPAGLEETPVASVLPAHDDEAHGLSGSSDPIVDDLPQSVGRVVRPVELVEPSTVEVRLFSVPRTVALVVGDHDMGRTPKKMELAPGRHAVRVTSGGVVATFDIDVSEQGANQWCYSFSESAAFEGKCP